MIDLLTDNVKKNKKDIVIVNANKPKFFEEGSTLREVDISTGRNNLAPVKAFQHNKVG